MSIIKIAETGQDLEKKLQELGININNQPPAYYRNHSRQHLPSTLLREEEDYYPTTNMDVTFVVRREQPVNGPEKVIRFLRTRETP